MFIFKNKVKFFLDLVRSIEYKSLNICISCSGSSLGFEYFKYFLDCEFYESRSFVFYNGFFSVFSKYLYNERIN